MATAEEKIEALEKMVKELQEKSTTIQPKVEVTLPANRKLRKFNGIDCDVRDWIDDAKSAIKGLKEDEKVAFLKRHLDGEARKEINLQPASVVAKPDDVFRVLEDSFGERRSSAKLKKALYSRVQGEKESVRDFTRAIMDLVNRLPHETDTTRNRLLNEVICDNLSSQAIRDECAKLVDKNIDVAFTDVRHVAMRMGDKDDSRSGTAINVNLVHARSDSDYDVECCARQGASLIPCISCPQLLRRC